MKPSLVDGLDWVNASYASAYGQIQSQWKNSIGQFEWQIRIPANTSAKIYLPTASVENISESGKALESIDGIKILNKESGNTVIEIGSGSYHFW